MLVTEQSGASGVVVPDKLDVYIGNAVLGAWHVRQQERSLTCTFEQNGAPDQNGLPITPSQQEWQAFRDAIEQAGVFRWQPDYPSTGVFDGTQWRIQISYADHQLAISGDNNFPDANGKANSSSVWTSSFRKFVAALRTLLGKASCIPDDL